MCLIVFNNISTFNNYTSFVTFCDVDDVESISNGMEKGNFFISIPSYCFWRMGKSLCKRLPMIQPLHSGQKLKIRCQNCSYSMALQSDVYPQSLEVSILLDRAISNFGNRAALSIESSYLFRGFSSGHSSRRLGILLPSMCSTWYFH